MNNQQAATTPHRQKTPTNEDQIISIISSPEHTVPFHHKESQTELQSSTLNRLIQQNSTIEELKSSLEDQRVLNIRQREMMHQNDILKNKMLETLKTALIGQAKTERKNARQKSGRDRMKLGYLTRTQGFGSSSSSDMWTNGTWLEQLEARRIAIAEDKDDIEKQRKLLNKRKPGRGSKADKNAMDGQGNKIIEGSNSDDSKDAFAKPRDPSGPLNTQEHYEQDEVLKIRMSVSIIGKDMKPYRFDLSIKILGEQKR